MKFPIAATVLALATLAVLGWHDRHRLADLRASHAEIAGKAAERGIYWDPSRGTLRSPARKGDRENREAEARNAAADFVAYAREMTALDKKRRKSPDAATRRRMMDQMERMLSLDAPQLEILIDELRGATELNTSTRANLIGFAIKRLAIDHPRAALAILTNRPDIAGDFGGESFRFSSDLIGESIRRLAEIDSEAALTWLQANIGKLSESQVESAKSRLIQGTAIHNPKRALQIAGDDPNVHILSLARVATTPEARIVSLAAFREWSETGTDEKRRKEVLKEVIPVLTFGESHQVKYFDHVTSWIDAAELSPWELGAVADALNPHVRVDETKRWVEWLSQTLPPDAAREPMRRLFSSWSSRDHKAAAEWLETAPESLARTVAIRAYAMTVVKYQPASAIRWAHAMPDGPDREQTLEYLHDHWPADHPAAQQTADPFTREQGLETE